jgi:hypothetical protein
MDTVSTPVSAKYSILIDSKSLYGHAWADSDQPSGLLFVSSAPIGEFSIPANLAKSITQADALKCTLNPNVMSQKYEPITTSTS